MSFARDEELKRLAQEKAALESQLQDIKQRQAELKTQEGKERAAVYARNVDALLEVFPNHDRTSCSDKDYYSNGSPPHVRCNRCYLLYGKDYGFDFDRVLTLDVRSC